MNKKVLGVFVSLLAVVMLALPMSAAYATKPEPTTMTLTGFFEVLPENIPGVPFSSPYVRAFPAGESGIFQVKWRGLPANFTGDIEGIGPYDGNWKIKNSGTPDAELSTVGIQLVENAVVAGIGTGDLKMKAKNDLLTIISGTGDLKDLKGEGTVEMLTGVLYSYSIEVQINP